MTARDKWLLWWDTKMLRFRAKTYRFTHRVGRRGAYLLFLSMLDILYGYSLIVANHTVGLRPDLFLSYYEWAAFWFAVGGICLWQAFVKLDRLAFSLAVTIKILWGFTVLVSWAITPTNPRGWVTAAIFIGFGLLTAVVSYWPEHQRLPDRRE